MNGKTTPRFPVGFPPFVRDIIKQQVGTLGNSEAEVVKNIVLIYLTEKGVLKLQQRKGGKER
ncbi:MAG: CopG family transcriptional regulator [Euryarchaeota archaeon]|nr:CopG family transcriptional regulator [Euryarchaeota archaeon]